MAPYKDATERPQTAEKELAPVSGEDKIVSVDDEKEAVIDQSPRQRSSQDIEKEAEIGDVTMHSAPEAILKHGLDADEALKAFIGHEGEHIVLNEETNRKLVRKIDLNILPVGSCIHANMDPQAYPLFRLCVWSTGSIIWTVSSLQVR